MSPTSDHSTPLHFRPRHRLIHARQFDAVYAAKVRKLRGPIMLFSLPNSLPHSRLGLSVSGRVGNAIRRNTWKRLIREAFRLQQHSLARTPEHTGYDLIVSIRASPDQPVWPLPACMKALADLVSEADKERRRRGTRITDDPAKTSPTPPDSGQQ